MLANLVLASSPLLEEWSDPPDIDILEKREKPSVSIEDRKVLN
jgi:hypothetical protein